MAENATDPAVPPKVLRNEVMRRDPLAGRPAALQRRGPMDLSKSPVSLPILEAFQDFLEAERTRTRNRILAMTLFFATVLLAVIGAGVLVGVYFHGRIKDDMAAVQRNVKTLEQLALEEARQTVLSIAAVAAETDRIGTSMTLERETIARIESQLESQTEHDDKVIDGVLNALSALELENVALRKELRSVLDEWGSVTNQYALVTTMEPLYSLENFAAAEVRTFPMPDYSTLVMSITPPGQSEGVAWRLPIPE